MITTKKLAYSAASIATVASMAFAPIAFAKDGEDKSEKSNFGSFVSSIFNKGQHSSNSDKDHKITPVRSLAASVEIKQDGRVEVRNATVTGVNGGTITATTALGNATLTWTVNASGLTSGIATGDRISFAGTLASGSSLTVNATNVKEVGGKAVVQKQNDIFQGTLQSVASTTLPTTLTLKVGGTVYTVNIASGTPVINSSFGATTLANFQVGDTVRVYGSLSATSSTTINALIVRDATR